jgi:O-antigen/teichoic acid export membrane protein
MVRNVKNNFLNHIVRKFNIDAHYFFHGGFWLTAGQIITILFGLLTTALFAHFLTEAEFGLYKYLIGISVILSSFSLTGIGQSILQATAKGYPGFYRETLKINFLYSLGITLAGAVGALYYWHNENDLLAMGCLLVALLQPFISSLQNIPSLLQGSKRFKENTTLHIARMFGVTLISIASLFLFESILALFFFYIFGNLLVLVVSNFLYAPPKQEVPENIFNQYLTYAKHTSFRNIISNIAQRADTIIVFTQLGAVELAVYSIALVIPEQIKGSFKNLASLLMPKYAKHEDKAQLLKSIPKRSFQLFVVLLMATVGYILLSPYIYQIIFPKYPDAILLSWIFALSFPAMVAILPVSALQSQLQEKKLYKILVLESITSLTLTIIFTFYFGLIGTVIAKTTTRYLTVVYDFFYLYR